MRGETDPEPAESPVSDLIRWFCSCGCSRPIELRWSRTRIATWREEFGKGRRCGRTEQSRSASGACFCCRGDRGAAVVAANFIGGVGHGRVEMCAPAAAYSRSLVALFGDADKRSPRHRLTHVQVPGSIDTTSTAPKADMANTKPQLTAALFAERLETGPRC